MLNIQEGDPHDLSLLETYFTANNYAAWLDVSPEEADAKKLLAKAKLVRII